MIWDFKEIKNLTQASNLISLNEGNTPEVKFNHEKTEIILKREDLNPTGSWKDRGTAFKVTELLEKKVEEAVIATSGNAAISFLTYLKQIPDFKLHVVVSKNINQNKLQKIKDLIINSNNQLYISDNSRKESVEIAAKTNCINLRSSIDESILKGYWTLGFELKKHILPDRIIGIFAPVSSGTAFVGMVQGLQLKLENDWQLPQMYAAQTTSTFPILKELDIDVVEGESLADAIVDKTALRSPQIIKAIKETNGGAMAITNSEITKADEFVKSKLNIELSNTSLLSVAAYLRLVEQNVKLDRVILIASGT